MQSRVTHVCPRKNGKPVVELKVVWNERHVRVSCDHDLCKNSSTIKYHMPRDVLVILITYFKNYY